MISHNLLLPFITTIKYLKKPLNQILLMAGNYIMGSLPGVVPQPCPAVPPTAPRPPLASSLEMGMQRAGERRQSAGWGEVLRRGSLTLPLGTNPGSSRGKPASSQPRRRAGGRCPSDLTGVGLGGSQTMKN